MPDSANTPAAITAVVRDYLDGMVFADEAKLRQAFHPDCFVIGHFDGGLEWISLDDFVAFVKENAAPPSDGKYHWDIEQSDVAGDTATVKVVDDYLGMRFTDYLTLLQHEGRWSIINKAFYVHPDEG